MVAFIPSVFWEWWQPAPAVHPRARLLVDAKALRAPAEAGEGPVWLPPLGAGVAMLWSGAAPSLPLSSTDRPPLQGWGVVYTEDQAGREPERLLAGREGYIALLLGARGPDAAQRPGWAVSAVAALLSAVDRLPRVGGWCNEGGCAMRLWRLAERLGRLARTWGAAFTVLYMLMLNGAEVGLPGVVKLDSGDVGEILRLNQNWVMYTPTPPRESGWFTVVGHELPEGPGAVADLLLALRTDR